MTTSIFLDSPGKNVASVLKRVKKFPRNFLAILLLAGITNASAAPFAYLGDRKLNSVAVVDMATYTTISTLPLDTAATGIVEVVANDATGKVYVATPSSIKVINSVTNTITGQVLLAFGATDQVKAMVVSPDGGKLYVLTATGKLAVIDTAGQSITTTLTVDSPALAIAMDTNGQKVYVATSGTVGKPALTVINGQTNTVEKVVPTGTFIASTLSVNPANDRLYMVGNSSNVIGDLLSYRVFDPVSSAITAVKVTPIPPEFQIQSFTSLAFNKDGSRLYFGAHSGPLTTDPKARLPVLEVDSTNGTVTKTLLIPIGYADEHTSIKLAPSFAKDKFVLAVFLNEHLHHYPVEPARRAVFMDVASNTVLKDITFTQYGDGDLLIGDILDPVSSTGVALTTTTLQANANPPLRRNIPVDFTARVTGNNPTGKVVFKVMSGKKDNDAFETISLALQNNMATLTVPACHGKWANHDLRKIVCSNAFTIIAKYKGDIHNQKSKSDVLEETR